MVFNNLANNISISGQRIDMGVQQCLISVHSEALKFRNLDTQLFQWHKICSILVKKVLKTDYQTGLPCCSQIALME